MRICALTGKLDRRVYNIPPPPNTAPKSLTKSLLKRRYGSKRVPMNSMSFVLRTALKKKVKELSLSQVN